MERGIDAVVRIVIHGRSRSRAGADLNFVRKSGGTDGYPIAKPNEQLLGQL